MELCFDYIDTEMEFAKFRFKHTEMRHSNRTHIGINAIEIHGDVRVVEQCVSQFGHIVCPVEDFDPWAIPDCV
jgi:hypothetical protein